MRQLVKQATSLNDIPELLEMLGRLEDAFDDIIIAAGGPDTRRFKWITQRAQSALDNDETWRDMPLPGDAHKHPDEVAVLRVRVKELKSIALNALLHLAMHEPHKAKELSDALLQQSQKQIKPIEN